MKVEFWFDVACPHAYLAATQLEALAERTDAELVWYPASLARIFAATGRTEPEAALPKTRLERQDLLRWADWYGVPLRLPDEDAPESDLALRAVTAAGEARAEAAKAVLLARWGHGRDVGDPDVLAEVLGEAGLDGPGIVSAADEPRAAEDLETLTKEAVGKGIFGVPSFVVGDALFWGQDRLRFVALALSGWRVETGEED